MRSCCIVQPICENEDGRKCGVGIYLPMLGVRRMNSAGYAVVRYKKASMHKKHSTRKTALVGFEPPLVFMHFDPGRLYRHSESAYVYDSSGCNLMV
jgi:hypothetical protein